MDEDLRIIKITYDNGVYCGQYVQEDGKAPKEHGTGIFIWNNGDRYEGDFIDGKRSGKGKISWPNGEIYVGWFENDHMSGQGILYSSDGNVSYDGEWVESCPVNKI